MLLIPDHNYVSKVLLKLSHNIIFGGHCIHVVFLMLSLLLLELTELLLHLSFTRLKETTTLGCSPKRLK